MSEYELYHHGVKGMKWGVRRKQRLSDTANAYKINVKKYNSQGHSEKGLLRHPDGTPVTKANTSRRVRKDLNTIYKQKEKESVKNTPEAQAARKEKMKKVAKVGAAAAGTALTAYGAYKLNQYVRDKNTQLRMQQAHDHVKNYVKIGTFDKYRGMSTKELIRVDKAYDTYLNDVYNHYSNKAKTDSFKNAAKNVATDYVKKARAKHNR